MEFEAGWLSRQLKNVKEDSKAMPKWMQRELYDSPAVRNTSDVEEIEPPKAEPIESEHLDC